MGGNINFYQTVQDILMDLEERITHVDKVIVFDELRCGPHGSISWKRLRNMFTDENRVISVTDVPVDENGIINYSTNSILG
ncbi:MAG: hypothetical protein P9L98_05210 [Candidatus Kaelpia imicola]|nr:hypothetical protein [Candidatus Kaelpia imicola]